MNTASIIRSMISSNCIILTRVTVLQRDIHKVPSKGNRVLLPKKRPRQINLGLFNLIFHEITGKHIYVSFIIHTLFLIVAIKKRSRDPLVRFFLNIEMPELIKPVTKSVL